MKMTKKISALLCAFALLLGVLSGCNNSPDNPTDPTAPDVVIGQNTNYTVNITSLGGLPLANVTILVYADEALTDLTGYGQTDAYGKASISLTGAEKYYLSLTNLPAGYVAESSYVMSSATTDIALSSQVISDPGLAGVSYGLGSVMHDFTITAANGTEYTLSKLLEQKDAVVLNFWYTTCSYCVAEFPYLDTVYQQFSGDVEVLALNNYADDSPSDVESFQNNFYEYYGTDDKTEGGLAFPMAYDEQGITDAFKLSGYPTTVATVLSALSMPAVCRRSPTGPIYLRPLSVTTTPRPYTAASVSCCRSSSLLTRCLPPMRSIPFFPAAISPSVTPAKRGPRMRKCPGLLSSAKRTACLVCTPPMPAWKAPMLPCTPM